jgi:predicted AlkP superfamily pyrophosphatase or phosphodiesterase
MIDVTAMISGKAFCLLFVFALIAHNDLLAQSNRKAVFIIVDGVPADVVERLDPPAIRAIADTAGYTRSYQGGVKGTYSQTPTISAPGYNNLITGVWANKHNVIDNDIAAPNYNYWNLFRLLEAKSSRYQTAIFSTWQDNRTRLIGEELEEAGDVKLDYAVDGLEHDTTNFPHDTSRMFIRNIDAAVASEAANYIREKGPDLTWIYLEFTDDMGHKFGDGPQLDSALLHADSLIHLVWDAVKDREGMFQEDWLLIVTTDHGRDASTGRHHGGQSDRERTTWIATNSRNLNSRYRQNPGVVDIFPSICNHLGVPIPENAARELDGVPFIGSIDLSDLRAVNNNGKITLTWNSHVTDASKAQVFVSQTNHFKKGFEPDKYTNVGEVFVRNQKFTFSISTDAPMLKVAMKGPHHWVNVWVMK